MTDQMKAANSTRALKDLNKNEERTLLNTSYGTRFARAGRNALSQEERNERWQSVAVLADENGQVPSEAQINKDQHDLVWVSVRGVQFLMVRWKSEDQEATDSPQAAQAALPTPAPDLPQVPPSSQAAPSHATVLLHDPFQALTQFPAGNIQYPLLPDPGQPDQAKWELQAQLDQHRAYQRQQPSSQQPIIQKQRDYLSALAANLGPGLAVDQTLAPCVSLGVTLAAENTKIKRTREMYEGDGVGIQDHNHDSHFDNFPPFENEIVNFDQQSYQNHGTESRLEHELKRRKVLGERQSLGNADSNEEVGICSSLRLVPLKLMI
jgi:hypothetical protein